MRNCENPMPEVEKAEKIRPLSLEELELVVGGHVEMDEDDKRTGLDDEKHDEEDSSKVESGGADDPDSESKNVNVGGDARSDIFEQMADMDYACGGSIDIDGWD